MTEAYINVESFGLKRDVGGINIYICIYTVPYNKQDVDLRQGREKMWIVQQDAFKETASWWCNRKTILHMAEYYFATINVSCQYQNVLAYKIIFDPHWNGELCWLLNHCKLCEGNKSSYVRCATCHMVC